MISCCTFGLIQEAKMSILSNTIKNVFRRLTINYNGSSPLLGCTSNILCTRDRHALPDRGLMRFKTKDQRNFQQNLWKRVHKCGLEAKLGTKGLRQSLWRRFLSGRYMMSAYDQFLFNYEPYMTKKEKKVAPKIPKNFPPYEVKKKPVVLRPVVPPRKRTDLKYK